MRTFRIVAYNNQANTVAIDTPGIVSLTCVLVVPDDSPGGIFTTNCTGSVTNGGDSADGNGPNAVVYNTNTLQLIASVPVDPPGGTGNLGSSSGEYREVMRHEFARAGVTPTTNTEFYVYVSHYKSVPTSSDAAIASAFS
jgi:hypothetical protein